MPPPPASSAVLVRALAGLVAHQRRPLRGVACGLPVPVLRQVVDARLPAAIHWTVIDPAGASATGVGHRSGVLLVRADPRRLLAAAAGSGHPGPDDATGGGNLPAAAQPFDIAVLDGAQMGRLDSEVHAWLALAARATRLGWVLRVGIDAPPPRALLRPRTWFGATREDGRTLEDWRRLLRQPGVPVLRAAPDGEGGLVVAGRGTSRPRQERG